LGEDQSLTTPIFYLKENFYFSLGMRGMFSLIDYTIKMKKETKVNYKMVSKEFAQLKNSENNFTLSPVFEINYSPYENFTLNLSNSLFNDYVGIKIGIEYDF